MQNGVRLTEQAHISDQIKQINRTRAWDQSLYNSLHYMVLDMLNIATICIQKRQNKQYMKINGWNSSTFGVRKW